MKFVPSPGWLLNLMMLCASAAAQQPAASSEAQRERLQEAVQTLLITLVQDPSFQATQDADWNLTYSQEARALTNFGAIFSSQFDQQADTHGLTVLAVTPNSSASQMGIRIGDRVRNLNGKSLLGLGAGAAGQARAYGEFSALLKALPDGGLMAIEVERNGQVVKHNGSLERWLLPAVTLDLSFPAEPVDGDAAQSDADAPSPEAVGREACGTLSLHHSPPHRHDLYPAYLTAINRVGGGAAMQRFHYLKPGAYTLTLNEVIPARELRLKHKRFEHRREARQLELEVEDGMVYHLGAKLLYERKQQSDHPEYWKPVVWRMEPGYCKGTPVAR